MKALMRVEFHEFCKGKVSFQVGVHTRSMDGWGFGEVVMGELSADVFKQVDVFSDVSAIDVA